MSPSTATTETHRLLPEARWFLTRAVAMSFDRHLRADAHNERFSRVV